MIYIPTNVQISQSPSVCLVHDNILRLFQIFVWTKAANMNRPILNALLDGRDCWLYLLFLNNVIIYNFKFFFLEHRLPSPILAILFRSFSLLFPNTSKLFGFPIFRYWASCAVHLISTFLLFGKYLAIVHFSN